MLQLALLLQGKPWVGRAVTVPFANVFFATSPVVHTPARRFLCHKCYMFSKKTRRPRGMHQMCFELLHVKGDKLMVLCRRSWSSFEGLAASACSSRGGPILRDCCSFFFFFTGINFFAFDELTLSYVINNHINALCICIPLFLGLWHAIYL